MRARARLLGVVARAAFVVACSSALGCSKPSPPTLAPTSVTVTQLTAQGLDLSVTLNATNPNAIALSSQGVNARVVIDETLDLGSVTSSQPITLPANQTSSITVPLSVKWTSVSALLQVAASARDLPYAVDGTVAMGGELVNVGVPFHLEGIVTRDQIASAAAHAVPGMKLLR
jgi:LEA14-like dessication related protein